MIFSIAAFLSYWYETEVFLAIGGMFIMGRFLYKWYQPILQTWPPNRSKAGRWILGALPVVGFALILFTLLTMASYDVVGIWVVFYIIMGYAWIYGGVFLLEYFLDLSWFYDTIHLDNKAAIFPAAGGFIGLTLIYAGANIGDGPGWWVVMIAGGLGYFAWLGLALLINKASNAIEHITVERDVGCGIRFGAYLLASGLILARASGGDWTSLWSTLLEFMAGWPVLPLAVLALIVEKGFTRQSRDGNSSQVASSALWGCIYLAYAVIALLLLPPFSDYPLSNPYEVFPWVN